MLRKYYSYVIMNVYCNNKILCRHNKNIMIIYYKRTGIVGVPSVYRELHVGGDGHDGRHRQLRERVRRYVADRRIGRELHGHAHVVGYAGEHHR